jgi:hypothetical protein
MFIPPSENIPKIVSISETIGVNDIYFFLFLPFALPNTEAASLFADLVLLGFFRTLDAALASFLDVFLTLVILTSFTFRI